MSVTAKRALRCADVEPLLDACADGELLLDDRTAVTSHVAGCAGCAAHLEQRQRQKALLAAAGRTVELPADVDARIHRALSRERGRERKAGVVVVAAALAVAALALVALQRLPTRSDQASAAGVAQESLQRHQRDLPVDVASPDPHRVASFLRERIGHAVHVPPLSGFSLEGGRVIEVGAKPAAHLVYRTGLGGRMSLIAIPDPDGSFARDKLGDASRQVLVDDGALHAMVFARGGAVYSIVGDVAPERLVEASGAFDR